MHVHSLLHCNLNTADLVSAAAFYDDLLGLRPGLKTARQPTDGRGLGYDGLATSEVWFLFDHRGPRIAPGLELMEWVAPALLGTHPTEPNHIGLAAVGYVVPSGGCDAGTEVIDHDGVPVDLAVGDVEAPEFAHVRLNCSDLEVSVAWYSRLGFTSSSRSVSPEVIRQSMHAGDAAPFRIELAEWRDPKWVGAAPPVANHRGLYRVALGVADIAAAHDELSREWPDIPQPLWVELPGTKLGGVTVLFLRDPDNVVIELVERPPPG